MKVVFSDGFAKQFWAFDDDVADIITDFAIHVEQYGLRGLQGRNKSSAPQNPQTKKEFANFAHAQKHCLWHYLRAEIAKQRFTRSQDKGYARSGHRSMLAMMVIRLRNISYITKDLMIKSCCWNYPPTCRLSYPK